MPFRGLFSAMFFYIFHFSLLKITLCSIEVLSAVPVMYLMEKPHVLDKSFRHESMVLLALSSVLMNQQSILKDDLNKSTHKTRLCIDWSLNKNTQKTRLCI